MKAAKISSLLFLPLALCAVVPDVAPEVQVDAVAQVESLEAPLFTVVDVGQFVNKVERIADEILPAYENKAETSDWPNNFQELVKLADSRLVMEYGDVTMREANPIQDVINGLFGAVNQVTGAINGVTSQLPRNITITNPDKSKVNITIKAPLVAVIEGVTKSADDLVSTLTNGTVPNFNALVTSLTSSTGLLISNLTSGVITPQTVNQTVTLIGSSIMDVASGKKDIVSVLTDSLNLVSTAVGASNPLGKYIQNVAVYLSQNPNGILAETIKFATFVDSLIQTITNIIKNVNTNISQAAISGISKIVQGIFLKAVNVIFGTNRLQQISAEELLPLEQALETMRTQSTSSSSSGLQLVADIVVKVTEKLFNVDMSTFSALTDPTDANIRRLVIEVAKGLTNKSE